MCNDFTPTLLNVLGIHKSITGEKGAANGALEKMAIGRLLVSVSTPHPECKHNLWCDKEDTTDS